MAVVTISASSTRMPKNSETHSPIRKINDRGVRSRLLPVAIVVVTVAAAVDVATLISRPA